MTQSGVWRETAQGTEHICGVSVGLLSEFDVVGLRDRHSGVFEAPADGVEIRVGVQWEADAGVVQVLQQRVVKLDGVYLSIVLLADPPGSHQLTALGDDQVQRAKRRDCGDGLSFAARCPRGDG